MSEEKGSTTETGAADKAAPKQKAEPAFTIATDGSRVRKLIKPIITHDGSCDKISLRKPSYRDIMDNGDPETMVVLQGGWVPQLDMMIIERYIKALSGFDPLLLEQLDYRDALALRDAVRSFFQ